MKKQNLKKIIIMGLIVASLITVAPVRANAAWEYNQRGGWYYANDDGSMKKGWVLDGGKWYYLDSYMIFSRAREIDGKWYYFNKDGSMMDTKVNWLSSNEALIDGTIYETSERYEYDAKAPSNYYYFKEKGVNGYWRDGTDGKSIRCLVDPSTNQILIGEDVVNPVDGKKYCALPSLSCGWMHDGNRFKYYDEDTKERKYGKIVDNNGDTYDLDDPHLNDFNYTIGGDFMSTFLEENPDKYNFLNNGINEEEYYKLLNS
ncbi:hypothetical protein [Clostridium butyricum]